MQNNHLTPERVEQAINVMQTEEKCVMRNISGCERRCELCDLVMPDKVLITGYDTALAALRAERERMNPQPLTLDELREMDWVWLDNDIHMRNSGWARVISMYGAVKLGVLQYGFGSYGKNWLAYRSRPEGGQEDA